MINIFHELFIYKCNNDIEESILISRLSSSIRSAFDTFAGEESGEDPVFNEEPRDNLSPLDLSEFPVILDKNPLMADPLLIDETLPDFDAATALSRTKRRC